MKKDRYESFPVWYFIVDTNDKLNEVSLMGAMGLVIVFVNVIGQKTMIRET